MRLPDGRLYVTDRATTNGTFVLDGGEWRAIRQAFVERTDSIRLGDRRMAGADLDTSCLRNSARASGSEAVGGKAVGSARPVDALDPSRRLVRDPETGELLEKQARRGLRRGTGR